METVQEEPEETPPTKVETGTSPIRQEEEGSTKVEAGTNPPDQEQEGPARVDTGTDPLEQVEEGPSQSTMEEQASKPTDLSQRGSRNLAQIDGEEVDTSKMKYVEGVQCARVDVMDTGFAVPEVIIMEGQGVLFEKGGRKTLEIVQVIHDGDNLRPVIGGFGSKDAKVKDKDDNYIQQFNLEGEYKFAVSKIRCTPLTVIVRRRLPLRAGVTDDGFNPQIIAVDQGDTVEWSWKDCTVPHSVQEVNYLFDKGVFVKSQWADGASNVVRTITGHFSKKFPRPGIYFFQTESSELHKQHFCVVRVRQSIREYKVEISDRAYHPPVLLIETGDRVWWYWDKFKCKKHHCVYQIEAPTLNQDDEEPYQPVQNGFRWSQPSKQGLLSHVFTEPGVFYYSDQNFQEAAEYIGTVIVKPKPKEHRVMIKEDGFEPDVVRIRTGERIWFWWNPILFSKKNIPVLLREVEKCLNPATKRPSTPEDESKYQHPDEETVKLITDVGFATVFYSTTGVYHYRVRNSTVCSVIVSPGEKNHTIHLTDSGPEQKVIMSVRPNDRVWWVWQSTKKQHNVIQVSHQGDPIPGGFCSGMPRDSPSAFVHTFEFPGVFYYKSQSLPKIFGAVVVTTQPVVHEVEVGPIIRPDPISVKVHDIVCWIFSKPQKENVVEITHPDQVTEDLQCEEVSARSCLSKAIDKTGVMHFYSKSFNKQKKNVENYLEDVRFSSVISDERYDNTVIKVDQQGFHPHFVYVQKGESVRWTWINTDEEHNIIHVTSPDSKEPLNVVGGVKSFNSGKQVKNNSFLYTFDELGSFTVASQGAPGYSCTVHVITSADHVKEPSVAPNSLNGGTVDQFSKIELVCETLGSKIFYTTDGSPPELHIESAKLYNPEKGVILKKHGLCFIRAMAVKEGLLNSSIFTSKRYWVLAKEGTVEESSSETETSGDQKEEKRQTPQKNDNWDWWSCAPTVKACFTDPGVMEVFWEEPNAIQKKLIKGYQIFLNGVRYCEMFPPNNNSLNITGLAGNRIYEVYVEVYSLDKKLNPQTSNKLTMKVPLMTKEGGPVISLERANKQDALVVVWMSIDTTEYPIKGYLVFLNDQQCGAMLVPDPDKNRCKVFIGGCELNKEHRIYVVALPKDNVEDGRMSNVIEVVLPLDTSQIVLPEEDERLDQEELYQEYISIQEGSGYLAAMDAKRHHIETNNVPPLTTSYQYTSSKQPTDRRPGAPAVVEVEDPRYRGVKPLKKKTTLQSKTPDLTSSNASHNASHPVSASDPHQKLSMPLPDGMLSHGYATPALEQSRPQSLVPSLADRISDRQRQRSIELVNECLNSRANSQANSEYFGGDPLSRDLSRRSSQKSFFQQQVNSPSVADQYLEMNPMIQRRLSLRSNRQGIDQHDMPSYSQSHHMPVLQAPPQLNVEEPQRHHHVSLRSAGTVAKLSQPQPVNLQLQKHKYPITFKMVAKAVKNFITQQNIVMTAIAPGRVKKRFRFDWPRFRTWIHITKPFDKEKDAGVMYQLQAPTPSIAPQEEDRATSEFVFNQHQTDHLRERHLNFMRQQLDPDLYPEHTGGQHRSPRHEYYSHEPPRSSRSSRFGHNLDVGRQEGSTYHGRSFDHASPDRSRRSPRFEFYGPEERHSPYRRESKSRSHSRSQERRLDMGPHDDWFEYQGRERSGPQRSARDYDSGFERNSHDERHSRDHGFYESESDYDEEYEDFIVSSDEYESPPYYAQESRRYREQPIYHRRGGPRGLPPRQKRHLPSYKKENVRSHRKRSPEDKQKQKIKSRGFDTDFGIYGGPGSKPPPLTLKEYNESQRKSRRKKRKRPKRHSALYNMLDQDVEYPPELPPALKTLATYGKMFHGQLLQDAIQMDHEDQSMMTDDNYEKGTQTPRGKSRVKNLRDSYGSGDFSEERAQSRRAQISDSESETESETGSSETESETESETASEGTRLSNEGSVMVVSMKDAKYAPKVTREVVQQSRPRSSYIARDDKTDTGTQSDITPRPPSARRYRDTHSARSDMSPPRLARRALIEVEETASIDLNEDHMMKSVVVSKERGSRRRQVEEGEPVYNPANDAQVGVPAPTIKVSSMGKSGLIVEWYIDNRIDSEYEVQQYIVNIVGRDFSAKDVNSHISFECNLVDNKGHSVRGTQHCWTLDGNKRKINIRGLYPDNTYRVFVVANYGFRDEEEEQKPIEVQATSPVIYYTTIGPPLPPFVRVLNVGLYQTTVQWDPPRLQSGLELLGYKIYVDNKVLQGLQRKDTRQLVINDLVPGKTIGVSVVAVLRQSGIESEPSRQIHITCPKRPPPPHISQQPLHKHGSVLVAWDKPGGVRRAVAQEGITSYRIYVNDKYFGKIDASPKMDRQGYQYVITGLNPEESYDVKVKSMAGQKHVDPDQNHIFCISESAFSNTIPVQAPAAPKSPELRLESMTPQGIRVTWLAPQQYGEAEISGYRLLKNGKLYGHVMGPDVNAVDITGISLGDKVVLQLVALTNHPVGKLERALMELERDESSPRQQDMLLGEKYAGCRPGPKLTVHYTGLVRGPDDVWLEQVTGHSALVVWKKEDKLHGHFVRPDHYVVTWWCGDKNDVQSEETKEDHILITGLHPATTYTIVVEARRMENYKVEGEENDTTNKFILTAQSEPLTLRTARPPDPPSNLSIAASTCNALRLVWDPPVEHGVEIIAIRIDAQSINTSDLHHVSVEVRPDECRADIEGLREKTDYVLRVTAVTDEYFDRLPERHKLKKVRSIPRDRMVAADDSIWLPNTYTMAKTAGTEPPANLKIVESSTSGLSVTWLLPIVYGSNKLIGQVLRWSDVKNSKKGDSEWYVASHINLDPADNNVTIEDLTPGAQYKIVVEAVVSIKTSLESAENDKDIQRYRRTANVMSKPLFTRTRAPTEPPRVYITGYTQTTAQLYWEKPPLVSVIGKENDGRPKYLRRYLEGYKLEINDRLHSCLGPNAQSCQLTKCKPGKKYRVVLVALTCTDQGKKDRKKKYKGVYRNVSLQTVDYSALLQDEDNLDPSPSEPLEVVLPRDQDGYIKSLECTFKHDEDRDNSTFGDIELRWETQGERSDVITHVKQFNVIWSNTEERQVQTRVVTPDARKTLIPVTRLKASYDIQVEPDYFTDALHQVNQKIQLVIPGPPDPPEIFLKSVSPEEFVIEWGEPRLFGGVKVRGYQVYLNDKKVGNELSNSHRKAVIPCRPNKNYKVQLVALSDNSFYSDSSFSNMLLVSTSPHSPRLLSGEDMIREDQDMIPVKVTTITETSIQLDWSNFIETEGVTGYKIQWSSVAQPAQREVKLSDKDSSCVINNCLPGTTHFVRLIAIDADGQILEKSKQLTIQTSAPPDAPILSVRACNFRYIAVQWEKPNTYGDALVTGYKVYVNGIVEAILNAEQMSFTFTHGKWCQEYAFQVQALTSFEKLHSKVSEPLVVVWPGCKAPALKRLATHSSSCVRIAWDDPYLTEGVKVKHFRAVCVERDTEKEVTPSIGPIHPNTREAEFKNLKRGSYSIFLEVHLYNTGDVVCSEPLHVAPAPAPDPPLVTVTVVGLDERRALERLTCDLVNKRDRLIRKVGHKLKEIGALSNPLRAEKNRGVIEGAHTLSRIEEILEHCFSALEHYTGQLIAHVSWSCPQRQSETSVSGFKVLIDGKQYGNTMHEGVKQVRIKLGTEQPIYKLTMVSVSDKPQASSAESNAVDLLSETFRPFSFYCYHSIHNQNARWPNQGCCKYQDSVMYERQLAKKLANQGLLKRKVPPPACSLLDIFQGDYKPFLGTHNKQFPTAILFWTPWCHGSQKVMSHYARFAREGASEYNFIAVSCGVEANHASDRKSLIHSITSNGWREQGVIWHCTSQCASPIDEASSVWKNSTAGSAPRNDIENGKKHVDLTEILGIAGVPTFLFIHADGYIAWHGRYSAYDYASFAAFMRHTFSEVQGVGCPVFQCDSCKNDMTIDDESLEPVLQLVRESSTSALSAPRYIEERRPHSPKRADSPTNADPPIDRIFMKKRPRSPKRHKKISVNQRPFSASNVTQAPSHYVQLLKSPYMQKTVPSPKVLNKLLRPQSGGARLG